MPTNPPTALSAIVSLICTAAQDVAVATAPGASTTTDIVLGSTLLGQIFANLSNFKAAYAAWKVITPEEVNALVLQLEAQFPTFGNAKFAALIPQIGALLEGAFGIVQTIQTSTPAPTT